jgi:hypothetical protein
MIDLDQVFCDVDDFNAEFEPQWKEPSLNLRVTSADQLPILV